MKLCNFILGDINRYKNQSKAQAGGKTQFFLSYRFLIPLDFLMALKFKPSTYIGKLGTDTMYLWFSFEFSFDTYTVDGSDVNRNEFSTWPRVSISPYIYKFDYRAYESIRNAQAFLNDGIVARNPTSDPNRKSVLCMSDFSNLLFYWWDEEGKGTGMTIKLIKWSLKKSTCAVRIVRADSIVSRAF